MIFSTKYNNFTIAYLYLFYIVRTKLTLIETLTIKLLTAFETAVYKCYKSENNLTSLIITKQKQIPCRSYCYIVKCGLLNVVNNLNLSHFYIDIVMILSKINNQWSHFKAHVNNLSSLELRNSRIMFKIYISKIWNRLQYRVCYYLPKRNPNYYICKWSYEIAVYKCY